MEWLLRFLYPKFCCACGQMGEWLCDECKQDLAWIELRCPVCKREVGGGGRHEGCKGDLDGLIAIYDYKDEAVREVVKAFKYGMVVELAGEVLEKVDLGVKEGEFDWIVPVALHRRRLNWRGFNQARVLAEIISESSGIKVVDALRRTRYTQSLSRLNNYRERKKEIKGVFEVKSGWKDRVGQKRVLLVDDVYTSGSTMREAAKAIREAGAGRVWGWVLASR